MIVNPARCLLVAMALLVASTAGADAQTAESTPPAGAPGVEPASHRFVDRLNVGLTVVESAALLADGTITQHGFHKYPNRLREGDPIARVFVSHGWGGQIAGGALFVGADVALRYWLHRSNHHRIERWLPSILTVYGVGSSIHNVRVLSRIAADQPHMPPFPE